MPCWLIPLLIALVPLGGPVGAWAQTPGWVLVAPPIIQIGMQTLPNEEAPLAEWNYISAYDTAASCEGNKERSLARLTEMTRRDPEIANTSPEFRRTAVSYTFSRCLPLSVWLGDRK